MTLAKKSLHCILNCPDLWFIYILMHRRGEWNLVQTGSQHKRIEQPIQPVFPDYPSIMTVI